jgi:phosphatidylglycerol---prolipoprotein diacylglyceryl transferase
MLGYWVWDPKKEVLPLNIPFLGRPILWYGVFFAIGFLLGYLFLVYLLRRYFFHSRLQEDSVKMSKALAEKILLYSVLGVVAGARLVDLVFYQGVQEIARDPLVLFRVWEGGLASHGGVVGLLASTFLFFRKKRSALEPLSFVGFLDFLCLPAAIISVCIRIGNFFNQEILGTLTTLPWAIIFLHPADGTAPGPRHPVQLYEAFFYGCLAIFLWKAKKHLGGKKQGKITGLFLTIVFSFRILVEYVKMEQSSLFASSSFFTMGQYLSVPLLLLGVFLLLQRPKEHASFQSK